jgi:ferredoxin
MKNYAGGATNALLPVRYRPIVRSTSTSKTRSSLFQTGAIQCGACTQICDHCARTYIDDTELFFSRLKRGDKISVLVAPAAQTISLTIKENLEAALQDIKQKIDSILQ